MSCKEQTKEKGFLSDQAAFFEGKALQDLYHADDLTSVDEVISRLTVLKVTFLGTVETLIKSWFVILGEQNDPIWGFRFLTILITEK